MLELDGVRLKRLATDPKGSHVVDSFLKSPTISEKHKDQFILKLKVHGDTFISSTFRKSDNDNLLQ